MANVTLEGTFRSVLLLQPRNNDRAALVAWFRQHDILGLAVREAGCLASELQVPLAPEGPIMVTAVWESAEAYAGWREHPVRATFSGDIERLTEPEAPPAVSGVYAIALTVEKP